jgi:hypothetical protein
MVWFLGKEVNRWDNDAGGALVSSPRFQLSSSKSGFVRGVVHRGVGLIEVRDANPERETPLTKPAPADTNPVDDLRSKS